MSLETAYVGESLRQTRVQRRLSLTDVADKAGISVATLSRVETNKQNLDVALLLVLARILGVSASDVLHDRKHAKPEESLSKRLAGLRRSERARLLFAASRHRDSAELRDTIDDLLATIDFLRAELMNVHRAVKSRRGR